MVKLYLVGGYVRDLQMNALLGTPMPKGKDKDYAVEASSYEEMRTWLLENGGDIKVEAPQYFTIRAKLGGEITDFALCRKEADYSDGRHPDSVSIGSIYDDLARRDFTMNALAIDCDTGKLIDPFYGSDDIEKMYIKCVGNAMGRMQEDYLRILRAVRFSITLGFSLDTDIVEVLNNEYCISQLKKTVSKERIREELTKMFKHDTYLTIRLLSNWYHLFNGLFDNTDMWLRPTMEKRR